MDRKRYLCYLALIAMPVVFLLLLLVIFGLLPLALVLILLLIIGVGVLNRRKPELFAPLRRDGGDIDITPPEIPSGPPPHRPERRAYLMLTGINAHNSSCITVDQPVFVIGRARDCQYILSDGMVSGHHLTIEYDSDEKLCYATDHSTNGTILNSVRLNKHARCALKSGDILQIAGIAYSVEYVHF